MRFVCLFALAALGTVVLSIGRLHLHAKPRIDSISPQVGTPGDVVTIKGDGFGKPHFAEGECAVEFGGYAFTQSAYIKWTDGEIVLRLPMDVQDGLVFVRTRCGVSNPAFFSNAQDVPIPASANTDAPKPVISALSAKTASVGDILTINGNGFGVFDGFDTPGKTAEKNSSYAVLFESAGKRLDALSVMGNIESWNNTEIKIRVTDGATTGPVTVVTPAGESDPQMLTVRSVNGTKYYGDARTYLVQLSADVNGINENSHSHIRLYFPRPVVSATQISAQITERIPDEAAELYQGTSLRILDIQKGDALKSNGKIRYQENYAITVRSVSVKLNNTPPSGKFMNGKIYNAATKADACVPASDSRITELAKEMTQDKSSAQGKARAIYDKMLDSFGLIETKTDTCYPLGLLDNGKGDAYDFAMIYTALLRAAGVPSFPCSGVIVDKEMHTKVSWWNVFYADGVGYVPVDMTAGKLSREAGFAKLDSQHVTFSIGYNAIKSAIRGGNSLQRQKSYSLQSLWEESDKQTRKYSSFWLDPVVAGVY